ncbi:hypothetical protein GCM10017673_40130 [Streptosporangium violaceochromogenes]|nr:hypothetical protein GCM10017673_40130 [Streptosporangium violaceochromogenes]
MGDVILTALIVFGVLAVAGFGLIGIHILRTERNNRRARHRRPQ